MNKRFLTLGFLVLANLALSLQAAGWTPAPKHTAWYENKYILATGVATLGGIIYGIANGLEENTTEAPATQLYKAVENQQSWIFPFFISGKLAERKLLQLADQSGTKRSYLYKEALAYAEQKYDAATATVLRHRLEEQSNIEYFATLQHLEVKPGVTAVQKPKPTIAPAKPVAPAAVAAIINDQKIEQTFSIKKMMVYCAATATVAGSAGYMLAARLKNKVINKLTDDYADLNQKVNAPECPICMDEANGAPNIVLHTIDGTGSPHLVCRVCAPHCRECPVCRARLNRQLINLQV